MATALQVPSWNNPYATAAYSNAYAVIRSLTIEPEEQRYTVHVSVFISQAAYTAGKAPIADRFYVSGDASGVFPSYATIIANSSFSTPLIALRNWMLTTIRTSDLLFTGSTEL